MRIHKMTTRMSSHSVVGVLILILNISIAIPAAFAADATSEQKLTVAKTLDVASLTKAGYNNFINQDIRFSKPFNDAQVQNIPVLPPANNENPQWLDLTLKGSEGKMIIVKIRVENLYVVGYQMQNSKKWLELGKTGDKRWITGSDFLGFGGDYAALATAAKKEITKVSLTQRDFIQAVKDLAESTNTEIRAQALILVIQVISEASRFTSVSDHVASNLKSQTSVYLQAWMLNDLEKNWSKLSKIWQCHYRYGDRYTYNNDVTINGVRITKVEQLKPYLGILHNEKTEVLANCGIKIIDFQALLQNVEPADVQA